MVPHVDPVYDVTQLRRRALLDEAARERLARQAKRQARRSQRSAGSRPSVVAALGWHLGGMLIGMGTRLQGGPRLGKTMLAAPAPSPGTSG